jgi:catechol 2,3-dioxygenase-like lactoylglutathione lyase family enzyme
LTQSSTLRLLYQSNYTKDTVSMAIIGVDHTSYTVSDMSRTLAFYRDLLGFEIIHERPAVTSTYFRSIIGFPDAIVHAVLLRIPGSTHCLEVLEYKQPRGIPQNLTPNNPGSSHIAYYVDDLLGMYPGLKAAGVEFISEPIYLDEGPNKGGWALYMKDPDGIVIELFQAAPK